MMWLPCNRVTDSASDPSMNVKNGRRVRGRDSHRECIWRVFRRAAVDVIVMSSDAHGPESLLLIVILRKMCALPVTLRTSTRMRTDHIATWIPVRLTSVTRYLHTSARHCMCVCVYICVWGMHAYVNQFLQSMETWRIEFFYYYNCYFDWQVTPVGGGAFTGSTHRGCARLAEHRRKIFSSKPNRKTL